MRKLILNQGFSVLSLALLIILSIYFFFFNKQRIAYVDSAKLLNGYKAMTDARQEFDKKSSVWKANVDTLMKDVQDAIRNYEKDAANGTPKEKQLSKELITSKQKQLYDYQQATQQNAQQEENRLTQNVLSQVNTFLTEYGRNKNYKLILVASNGNIAYADTGIDITDQVVDELNSRYNPKAGSGK